MPTRQLGAPPRWWASGRSAPWRTGSWGVAVLAVVGCAVYSWSTLSVLRSARGSSPLWDGYVYYGVGGLAVLLLLGRVLAGKDGRGFWVSLTVGNALLTAASLVFTFHDQHLHPYPTPAASDIGHYAGYAVIYAGLLLVVHGAGRGVHVAWLDGVIAGLGVSAVAGAVLLEPLVHQTRASTAAVVYDLVYPLADLLLAALVIAAVMAGALPGGPSTWAIVSGLLMLCVGDGVYIYLVTTSGYRPGTLLDSSWLVATVLMGVAGWLPAKAPPERRDPQLGGVLVPTAFAAVSLAVILLGAYADVPGPAVAFAAASLVLATARTVLTARELQRLYDSHRLARTDDLTRLPNRRALREHLDLAYVTGEPVCFLLLDLDGFKEVNDTLGHEAGDLLLVEVAQRLAAASPHGAFVARLGGDEFGLVVTGRAGLGVAVAHAITAYLDQPTQVLGHDVPVRASIGVATSETATDRSELMRLADVAMYHAKRNGLGVSAAPLEWSASI